MGQLSMCRICLVENVRMHVVVNKSLQELYEKLTDIPFVAEDNRPMLACFICYAKLKRCCQLQRQCLQAEELFAQMLNESYEHTLLKNRSHLQYLCGFVKTAVENISIVDAGQTESEAVEIELPAVCERQYNVQVKKEPTPSDGLENPYNSCPNVKDKPPHHSKSESEDDVRTIEFKIEVEEEPEVCEKERRAWDMEDPQCHVKKELDMSSDGERRKDSGAASSDGDTKYEMKWKNEIEQKKKIQNKIRCQRYREKKKNTDATITPQTKHKTMTAEDEERLKRRKEYDKQKSKRYRDRKRQNNMIHLQADKSLKTVKSLSKCKNFLSTQIAGPSNLSYLPPQTQNPDLFLKKSENEDESYNDTSLQVNYVPQILEPVITIYVPNTQNNTQLTPFSDGGVRGQSEETNSSDGTAQNEMLLKLKERKSMLKNEIEERKKILNKIRCQRYRENKKRNAEAMGSPQTHIITAEDEEKIKLRREYDKQKSKRYRDRKRATLINLHTDKSLVKS